MRSKAQLRTHTLPCQKDSCHKETLPVLSPLHQLLQTRTVLLTTPLRTRRAEVLQQKGTLWPQHCWAAQPWHPQPLLLQRTNTEKYRVTHINFSSKSKSSPNPMPGAGKGSGQVATVAPSAGKCWLSAGKQTPGTARAQRRSLLLRAFNEASMFHFRDKRAPCHAGGAKMGKRK